MFAKLAFFFFGWRLRSLLPVVAQVALRAIGRHCSSLSLSALGLCICLSGCGGADDRNAVPPNALAQHLVGASEIPDLSRCLGQIGAARRTGSRQTAINFNCASGTYQGLTNEGRTCALKIDGSTRMFRFQVEQEIVAIKWEIVAHGADGSPLDNLEDASAPAQPGIQLTRFTGSLIPVTEALILRLSAGGPGLPEMIYQRSADSVSKSITCNFGK